MKIIFGIGLLTLVAFSAFSQMSAETEKVIKRTERDGSQAVIPCGELVAWLILIFLKCICQIGLEVAKMQSQHKVF